jgi:hypothetical protein
MDGEVLQTSNHLVVIRSNDESTQLFSRLFQEKYTGTSGEFPTTFFVYWQGTKEQTYFLFLMISISPSQILTSSVSCIHISPYKWLQYSTDKKGNKKCYNVNLFFAGH